MWHRLGRGHWARRALEQYGNGVVRAAGHHLQAHLARAVVRDKRVEVLRVERGALLAGRGFDELRVG